MTEYVTMPARKRIALIAHDNKKAALLEWCRTNLTWLQHHELCGTGTTGGIISRELNLPVQRFRSGPLGGDQQIGAKIVEDALDLLIFFWDPLEPQPHDVDVKALLRIAALYNIPIACNVASADFFATSTLLSVEYSRFIPPAVRPKE